MPGIAPEGILYGSDGDQFDFSAGSTTVVATGKQLPLGTQLVMQDGRKYRYCRAGGSTLVVGNVISSAAIVATDIDNTAAAAAVGDRSISFTHGAGTTIADYFAEGAVIVSVTPGGGDMYKILNHAALTSGGVDTVNLAPGFAVRRALTTTSRVDLIAHAYQAVIQCAATISGTPVGVAISAITAGGYGWLATRGVHGVLTAGTLTIGSPAVALLSGGTAGAVAPASAATQPQVGVVQSLAASTAWSAVYVTIDG